MNDLASLSLFFLIGKVGTIVTSFDYCVVVCSFIGEARNASSTVSVTKNLLQIVRFPLSFCFEFKGSPDVSSDSSSKTIRLYLIYKTFHNIHPAL